MHHAPSDHLDVIRVVRDARFAAGTFCPRCNSREVMRWGGFSGRQRYRCKSCGRTFSDLTRTAYAYTKHPGKWPHYLVLMRQGRTLRAAATQLGIHVSTAFRWRHAVLSLATSIDPAALSGTVEVKEILFAHSIKGCRHVHAPRLRGARTAGWRWNQVPRDRVLLAFSRAGVAHSAVVGGDVATLDAVRNWTRARLAGHCTVFSYSPRAGPIGSAIRVEGHDYRMLRVVVDSHGLRPQHTRNVDAYARRLLDWLNRFRGVASRYRANYLYWHGRIDADCELLWARGLIVASTPIQPSGGDSGRACSCPDRPP